MPVARTSAPEAVPRNRLASRCEEGSYEIGIDRREIGGILAVRNTELSVAALGDG